MFTYKNLNEGFVYPQKITTFVADSRGKKDEQPRGYSPQQT